MFQWRSGALARAQISYHCFGGVNIELISNSAKKGAYELTNSGIMLLPLLKLKSMCRALSFNQSKENDGCDKGNKQHICACRVPWVVKWLLLHQWWQPRLPRSNQSNGSLIIGPVRVPKFSLCLFINSYAWIELIVIHYKTSLWCD